MKRYEPKNFEKNYEKYLLCLLTEGYKLYENKDRAQKECNKILRKLGDSGAVVNDESKNRYKIYNDPDKKENVDFYNDLSDFLNAASCEHRKDLLFKANGLSKKGIMVYRKKDKKEYFTIQSDQLGFSAVPWIYFRKNYPLSRYLEMQKNKLDKLKNKSDIDVVADFLTKYVYTTRTLGGSFLWPESLWSTYNKNRGNGNYIEDRVDLTLLEIKHYFEYRDLDDKKKFKYRRDILFSRYKIPDAQTWFGFFDSFEDYVDFFMFNDFVEDIGIGGKKEYMPINILNGEPFEKDCLYYEEDILKNICEKGLKDVLERVMNMVANRTKNMEKLIAKYNQTNDTKGEKHENILHE
jgi:hypothetical protein